MRRRWPSSTSCSSSTPVSTTAPSPLGARPPPNTKAATHSRIFAIANDGVEKSDLTMGKSTTPASTSVAVIDALLRQELDELVASMCKALNDPKRLLLLYALRNGRYTVSE